MAVYRRYVGGMLMDRLITAAPTPTPSFSQLLGVVSDPAQIVKDKLLSVLTEDDILLFQDMMRRVRSVMTPADMALMAPMAATAMSDAAQGAEPDSLSCVMNPHLTSPQNPIFQQADDDDSIVPGYNCIDHEMALTYLLKWLDDSSAVGFVKEHTPTLDDGGRAAVNIRLKKTVITVEPKWHTPCGLHVLTGVDAMLAGATCRAPDLYHVSDGKMGYDISHLEIALERARLAQPPEEDSDAGYLSSPYFNIVTSSPPWDPADVIGGVNPDTLKKERDAMAAAEEDIRANAGKNILAGPSPFSSSLRVSSKPNPITGVPDFTPLDDLVISLTNQGVSLNLEAIQETATLFGVDETLEHINKALADQLNGSALVVAPVNAPTLAQAAAQPAVFVQTAGSQSVGTSNFQIANTSVASSHYPYTTSGIGSYVASSSVIAGPSAFDYSTPAYDRTYKLKPGHTYLLDDGSKIEVDPIGNYAIHDQEAKITYRGARMRDFNRYVNASDLVGEFIEDLGQLGANQDQAATAPLEMFIRWLVFGAAKQDGEAPPEDVPPVAFDQPITLLPDRVLVAL
jgi:hypothetical protein